MAVAGNAVGGIARRLIRAGVMATYADDATMGAARAAYFAANGFGDGGYDDAWVKFTIGPLPLVIPNSPQRVRSVRLHDLHHVVTGYDTTWTGEGEIGAWEIASSCADHHAAWILNLEAMAIGLGLAPGAMFRAFVRGRHSRNFYDREFDEALLEPTVGAMRRTLALDRPPPGATSRDVLAFAAWSLASVLTLAATVTLVFGPAVALVAWLL
jgi:hypothetical protein